MPLSRSSDHHTKRLVSTLPFLVPPTSPPPKTPSLFVGRLSRNINFHFAQCLHIPIGRPDKKTLESMNRIVVEHVKKRMPSHHQFVFISALIVGLAVVVVVVSFSISEYGTTICIGLTGSD